MDKNIGLDMDISIRCNGEYSYKITDPMLFYKNVCGNVSDSYTREKLDSQLKTEFLTALQPAFARISDMGIPLFRSARPHVGAGRRYERRPLRQVERTAWPERGQCRRELRHRLPRRTENTIKELQRNATLRDPSMAAAHLVGAQAAAMQSAAKNESGAMTGFMGMGFAQQAGGTNANALFQQAAQQPSCSCRSCGQCQQLEMHLRHGEYRQFLRELRLQAAGGRLDLLLRPGEPGQLLLQLRCQTPRRRTPVPL